MTPTELTYERYEGEAAAAQLDSFLAAYEEVYAEPPYCEGPSDIAQFIEHYQAQSSRPGMRLVLARDAEEVVGFTYGYPLPASTGWWASVQEAPPRRRHRAPHKVAPPRGDVERVTLAVRPEPEARAAQAAYLAWGYREVGVAHPWEEAPFYTAMVLDLRKQGGDANLH